MPALTAVMAKPAIIMIQTMVAAGARRAGSARSASSVRSDVPAAPTPTPMRMNATMPSERPNASWVCMIAVASAASAPPLASTAMPPMIHGVRLRPAVRSMPPARAQDLHGVMHRDEKARHKRGQADLDDHDAIERRRRQHDDGADSGLHQSDADDLEPCEMSRDRRGLVHGVTPEPSAIAVTSMPST